MSLNTFVLIAALVEGLTGIVKSILKSAGVGLPDWADQVISLAVSMAIAIAGRVDFFAVLAQAVPMSLDLPAFLGIVFSGLILSRGSNGIHDVMKNLNPRAEEKRIW